MSRFLVFNDMHAQWGDATPAHPGYPGAERRAEWLMGQLATPGAFGGLDFAVAAGDLIHGENLPVIDAQMRALHARFAGLPLPILPCVGNHEIRQMEGDAAHEAPYRATFGSDRMDYVAAAGTADLIVLNNAGCFHVTPERREARYNFLRGALQDNPARPKILVCHIPLIPLRDPDVLRESFGFLSWRNLDIELLDLLDAHGHAVKLVISGHLHLTGMVERRGIAHLVTAGTASFPHDIAVVDVQPEAITVEVIALPDDLHEPATNLHGRPRYASDFTDALHPDPATYLRGTPAERRFTCR